LKEMEDNRRGGKFGQGYKFYDYAALEKLNTQGSGSGDGGDEDGDKAEHCNLGTPAFLRELRAWEGPIPLQFTLNKYNPQA
jgi:hypothetical protein